jgi:hypothetical protein
MLTDIFTKAELLAAADAAEVYPKARSRAWGVDSKRNSLDWNDTFISARHL